MFKLFYFKFDEQVINILRNHLILVLDQTLIKVLWQLFIYYLIGNTILYPVEKNLTSLFCPLRSSFFPRCRGGYDSIRTLTFAINKRINIKTFQANQKIYQYNAHHSAQLYNFVVIQSLEGQYFVLQYCVFYFKAYID